MTLDQYLTDRDSFVGAVRAVGAELNTAVTIE